MKKLVLLWTVLMAILVVGCGPSPQSETEGTAAGSPELAAVAEGQALYEANGCITCHGPQGAGDGPLAGMLPTTPRDLSQPTSYRGGTSDIEIAETLRTGISSSGMPSYAHIPVEERLQIARYLISLKEKASSASDASDVGESPASERKLQVHAIGGDFQLTDQNGEAFEMSSLDGQIRILFFGYTSCPDFCPMTLSKVNQIRKLLGDAGEDLMTVFVSVDPERDTPEKVAEYLGFFDLGQTVGLTGSREEVDKVLELYSAAYEKVEAETALKYLVNHTTYLFLVDRENAVRAIFPHYEAPEHIAMGIRVLLREQPGA